MRFKERYQDIAFLANVVTIAGFLFIGYQVVDLKSQNQDRSLNLLDQYDLQLGLGTNPGIRHAIDGHRPILKANGGNFEEAELADYLDAYQSLLSDSLDRKKIPVELLCSDQCYYLEEAYSYQEVQQYIRELQKKDPPGSPGSYRNFEELAPQVIEYGRQHPD